jgi:hypothetical protein
MNAAICPNRLSAGTASVPPGAGGGYFIIKNSMGGVCAGDMGFGYMPAAAGTDQEATPMHSSRVQMLVFSFLATAPVLKSGGKAL